VTASSITSLHRKSKVICLEQKTARIMNRTLCISVLSAVIGLIALWGVFYQHRTIAALRQAQETRLGQISKTPDSVAVAAAAPSTPELNPPSDLIQIRAEVARYTQRRRELGSVRAENEALRAKLAEAANSPQTADAKASPYIRKHQARMLGYGSPEDTLETFLWSVNVRDTNALFEAFAPEAAAKMATEFANGGFDGAEALVGLRVVSKETLPDGRIKLMVEMAPSVPPEPMTFIHVGDKWKMAGPE
jgi:hypothetical protein